MIRASNIRFNSGRDKIVAKNMPTCKKKGMVWRSLPVLCVTLSAVADSQGIL